MIRVVSDYGPCIALRREVFMEEQGISEADEMDDLDDEAVHLLATDAGAPVGAARILFDGNIGKIGRICVVKSARGTGLGAALVNAAVDHLIQRGDITKAKLSAQEYAIGFYAKLGFVAEGPFYDDAGIPHRDMVKTL